MDEPILMLRSLGIALLVGALIGLEREYHHRLKQEVGFAGLRTFMFFSALGALATWIAREVEPLVLPLAFLGLVLLLAVAAFRARPEDRGMTTEVAALLTFLLGSLVAIGRVEAAVALGVVIAALLSAKPVLRGWVDRLATEDIYTTLKFAVVAFVVFPILPDRAYGPLAAINPHEIWIMVVLISGVSFLGYVALKLLGPERGVVVSGFLGGLVSSTAVALSFSRRSRENPDLAKGCALAILVSSTVMVGRLAVLVGVVNPSLLRGLGIPLGLLGAAGVLVSLGLWIRARHARDGGGALVIHNPFRLPTVLAFGAAYGVVLFLVKAARTFLPEGSSLLVGAISGVAQVDAITLSASQLAHTELPMRMAGATILVGALANTATKAVIAGLLGDPAIRRPVYLGLGTVFAAGLLGLGLVLR